MSQGRQELVLAVIGLLQLLVQARALADVAGDVRSADDPSTLILKRREAHGRLEALAVLAQPNRLVMFDSLAALEPFHDLRVFLRTFGRKEKRNGFADDLF